VHPSDFSWALQMLKRGKRISRAGWNGKGLWVEMAEIYMPVIGLDLEPFFVIKNVSGTLNTWVPSVSDLLAEDWEVVE